jgi:hypothetical protein
MKHDDRSDPLPGQRPARASEQWPEAWSEAGAAALAGLPRAIEPPRDLWPGIAARLHEERRGRRRFDGWLWPAAAAVLLAAASSLITAALLDGQREDAAMVAAGAKGGVRIVPAAFGPAHTLDREYVDARRELSSQLQARMERMPPSARQKLEANLAELRRAADEINAALVEQPGDPLLEELLLNTYQDELAVLASVNQLTNPGNGAGSKASVAKGIQL